MDLWLLILNGPSRELQESAVVIYGDMQELKWAIVAILYMKRENAHSKLELQATHSNAQYIRCSETWLKVRQGNWSIGYKHTLPIVASNNLHKNQTNTTINPH